MLRKIVDFDWKKIIFAELMKTRKSRDTDSAAAKVHAVAHKINVNEGF